MNADESSGPFGALGLAARPDLSDDDVRSAWRRIAAETHPDRADGGDPAAFADAAAAYTVLRTRFGRTEAFADLAAARPRRWPLRSPGSHGSLRSRMPGWLAVRPPLTWVSQGRAGRLLARVWQGRAGRLLARVRQGRPGRLAVRLAVAAGVSAGVVWVAGARPATPAVVVGVLTWLVLTARHDVARH